MRWLLLPALLAPEAWLKWQSYQRPPVGQLLELEFEGQSLRPGTEHTEMPL